VSESVYVAVIEILCDNDNFGDGGVGDDDDGDAD